MKIFRVKQWDELFESAKSKDYGIKSQTYMPNKFGEGYWRIIANPAYQEHAPDLQGAAIYGAWCAMICLLSRKKAPRRGYLTDTSMVHGVPMTASSIAVQTGIHVGVVAKMLEICSAKDVGWLEVVEVADTVVAATGIAHGYPPLPLPNPYQTNPNPTLVRPAAHGDVVEKKAPATPADNNGDFDAFWKAYPRKVGKTAAHNVWKKLKPRPPLEKILAAIKAQAATDQWQRDGGQYIPHPTTWLRQGRYEDEVATTVQTYRSKI